MNDPSQGQSDPALLNTSLAGLYPVEIAVEHADPRLRVGMAATAAIEVLSIRDVLTIPLQAVVDGVVQRESGEQVTVELGAVSGDRVEIRAGLAEGDRIMVPTIPASSDPAGLP
jgi:HlyD family secretion protein